MTIHSTIKARLPVSQKCTEHISKNKNICKPDKKHRKAISIMVKPMCPHA